MHQYINKINTSKKPKNYKKKKDQPQQTLDDLVEDFKSLRPKDDKVGVSGRRQLVLKVAKESKFGDVAASEDLKAMESKKSWRFKGHRGTYSSQIEGYKHPAHIRVLSASNKPLLESVDIFHASFLYQGCLLAEINLNQFYTTDQQRH